MLLNGYIRRKKLILEIQNSYRDYPLSSKYNPKQTDGTRMRILTTYKKNLRSFQILLSIYEYSCHADLSQP